jgi:hypothetical protein
VTYRIGIENQAGLKGSAFFYAFLLQNGGRIRLKWPADPLYQQETAVSSELDTLTL